MFFSYEDEHRKGIKCERHLKYINATFSLDPTNRHILPLSTHHILLLPMPPHFFITAHGPSWRFTARLVDVSLGKVLHWSRKAHSPLIISRCGSMPNLAWLCMTSNGTVVKKNRNSWSTSPSDLLFLFLVSTAGLRRKGTCTLRLRLIKNF